ncbi:hypothetical protein SISSUDRAFT_654515 [Sistotremastrum suecicum HHB10207 ss-3]|nr:hypothetical protein SISSUDRAFT_654515 [Sistotremastrum suecicum HHB10207 ss-3]
MNGVPGLNKTFTSDPVAIQRLRSRLPPPKEGYSLQPRDAEEVQLKARMERAYERIGKPRRRVENAWNIFQQMLPHLEQ